MEAILGILISALLSQNFILVKFYGICPFMGVSKKIDTALGMGVAVTFVMALASAACWAVDVYLLQTFNLGYMSTVSFILVIASLVQVVEMFLKKFVPALYKALGVFLPLITTNCAVLGVVLVNAQNGYHVADAWQFLLSIVNGAAGGLGFTLAIVLFASIRERVDKADPPECFKGFPITLIAAGLLADQCASAEAESGLYADRGFHSGHCYPGPGGGNVPEEVRSRPVQGTGRVPASDHHQLRRSGRGSGQRPGRLQLPAEHRQRRCRRSGLHPGHRAVRLCPGAGQQG